MMRGKGFLATLLVFLTICTYAQHITVNIDDFKQKFHGAGGTSDSFNGHWISMSSENRDLAAKLVAEDIHLKYVKNYINGTPATSGESYDNFVSFVNDIRVYNPDIKVQICTQDFPDELEKKDGNGDAIKGRYDETLTDIYQNIAQYYFDVVKGFHDRGVTVDELDLLNEPGGTDYAVYYGKLFSEAVPIFKTLISDYNTANPGDEITTPLIGGTSQWSVLGVINWFNVWETDLPEAFQYLDVVSTHGYRNGWDEANYQDIFDYIHEKAWMNGQPFMNNEQTGKLQETDGLYEIFGQSEPDYIGDISIAMRMSDAINGGVEHFFIFNLGNSSGNNAALLQTPSGGIPSKSKVYSGFKQVSSTQPSGSYVLGKQLTNLDKNRVVCFREDGSNDIYVHITNITADPMQVTIDVKDISSTIAGIQQIKAWVSDRNLDEELVLDQTFAQSKSKIAYNTAPFSVNSLKITIDPTGFQSTQNAQTITFNSITDQTLDGSVSLNASSSSALPVSFEVFEGPGVLNGNELSFNGIGKVTIRAKQDGNESTLPAADIYQSFVVYPTLENIALNKTATASSEYNSTYIASKAIDGDRNSNSSRWLSKKVDDEYYPQWLEVDLGAEYLINGFGFWTGYDGPGIPIYDFEFQIWTGSDWMSVYSEKGNIQTSYLKTINVTKTSKVRFYVNEGEGNNIKLFEFEVYGEEYTSTNLALNRPVNVSSIYNSSTSYVGNKAVDGDISSNSSRWLSEKNAGMPQWIEIELDGQCSVKGMAFYVGYSSYKDPIIDFDFEAWDGSQWVNIFSETNNDNPAYSNFFDAVQTDKVRLYMNESTDDEAKVFEVEVYGNKVTTSINNHEIEKPQVFPNPIVGDFLIIENINQIKTVELFNITGQKIYCELSGNKLDVSHLQPGLYLITINSLYTIKVLRK